MNRFNRRGLLAMAAAAPFGMYGCGRQEQAAPAPAAAAKMEPSVVNGVKLGVQTYSYHDILVDGADHTDQIIDHMKQNGLTFCELFSAQVEPGTFLGRPPAADVCPKPDVGCPPGQGGSERNGFAWVFQQKTGEELEKARAAMVAFRESKPAAFYESVRRRFDDAGIQIYTYNPILGSLAEDAKLPEDEIDGVFFAAKSLGVKAINASIRRSTLEQIIPFAEKYQMIIAVHGHSVVSDPGEFSTRKTFVDAFELSPLVWANLDIGHYTAAGEDPVAFIREFHDRITNLHLKDRTRNTSTAVEDGANVPWGQGDTPIGEVLRLLRDEKYDIPAFIEIEHIGQTTAVQEVQIAYDYCKRELAQQA